MQLSSNDARSNRDSLFISRVDNGIGGIGIDLQLNNQPTGNFGIGKFTANSSTQSFNIAGILNNSGNGGRVQVNAIQLRSLEATDLLPGAVPLVNEFSASNSDVLDDDIENSTD